ncbi:MAG: transcription antitermination factor NusB [Bacteroidaceae bacterium]|nr:transcription antitermination factor NusB [Bacteroidaceae bacterium]MBR1902722.1 transcription antitermination factor NusB [Bacteroidaceae bacterium]
MINRELIRLKLVQIAYSYYQSGSKNPAAAEKELLMSLSRAYALYNTMLLLMVELNRMALRTLEMRQSRAKRLGEKDALSTKFVDNRFMLQLESNKQLLEFRDNQRFDWADQEEFVRSLYTKIEESEFYKMYMDSSKNSYEEDREVWRLIYRHLICNNEELDAVLEEMDLYWNDDKVIVDTFVLKTINRFTADSTDDQPLMPEYRDSSDQEFAIRLLQKAIANKDYYYDLIASTTRKWDINRVALMDRIILQLALAEIISFPGIPVSVSINEYVEIAKMYSTSKSGKYINATLDNIAKRLIEENKLIKNE